VAWRERPDLHKRAMFLATFSIAVVGLGRLVGRMELDSAMLWQPLNLAPLLIAIAYDAAVCRRLYGVVVVGLIVHLIRLNAEYFVETEPWLRIGRAIIAPSA